MSEWADRGEDRHGGEREALQTGPVNALGRDDLLKELDTALTTPPVGLILVELRFGEAADDERALTLLTECLAEQAEPGDITVVVCSEGFALIRTATKGPAEAEGLAFRMHKALTEPTTIDGQQVSSQAAMGVATSLAGDSGHQLLHYAEHALGDAKMLGGDVVVVFDDEDRELLLP